MLGELKPHQDPHDGDGGGDERKDSDATNPGRDVGSALRAEIHIPREVAEVDRSNHIVWMNIKPVTGNCEMEMPERVTELECPSPQKWLPIKVGFGKAYREAVGSSLDNGPDSN